MSTKSTPKTGTPRRSPKAKGAVATPAPGLPVRVEIHVGGAREVYLAGTFNDWHETTLPMVDLGRGRWAKELVLPPGEYEYLLIADGRWLPDPEAACSVPNPFGGVNSVLRVG